MRRRMLAAALACTLLAGCGPVRTEPVEQETPTIKPEAVDPEDVEMLQDLVVSAVNEALRQAGEAMDKSIEQATGGLDLGAFGL